MQVGPTSFFRLLRSGESVLLFPGGVREVCPCRRPSKETISILTSIAGTTSNARNSFRLWRNFGYKRLFRWANIFRGQNSHPSSRHFGYKVLRFLRFPTVNGYPCYIQPRLMLTSHSQFDTSTLHQFGQWAVKASDRGVYCCRLSSSRAL